jgi:hypothetical protein
MLPRRVASGTPRISNSQRFSQAHHSTSPHAAHSVEECEPWLHGIRRTHGVAPDQKAAHSPGRPEAHACCAASRPARAAWTAFCARGLSRAPPPIGACSRRRSLNVPDHRRRSQDHSAQVQDRPGSRRRGPGGAPRVKPRLCAVTRSPSGLRCQVFAGPPLPSCIRRHPWLWDSPLRRGLLGARWSDRTARRVAGLDPRAILAISRGRAFATAAARAVRSERGGAPSCCRPVIARSRPSPVHPRGRRFRDNAADGLL